MKIEVAVGEGWDEIASLDDVRPESRDVFLLFQEWAKAYKLYRQDVEKMYPERKPVFVQAFVGLLWKTGMLQIHDSEDITTVVSRGATPKPEHTNRLATVDVTRREVLEIRNAIATLKQVMDIEKEFDERTRH